MPSSIRWPSVSGLRLAGPTVQTILARRNGLARGCFSSVGTVGAAAPSDDDEGATRSTGDAMGTSFLVTKHLPELGVGVGSRRVYRSCRHYLALRTGRRPSSARESSFL